jgi:hypothetical protein
LTIVLKRQAGRQARSVRQVGGPAMQAGQCTGRQAGGRARRAGQAGGPGGRAGRQAGRQAGVRGCSGGGGVGRQSETVCPCQPLLAGAQAETDFSWNVSGVRKREPIGTESVEGDLGTQLN